MELYTDEIFGPVLLGAARETYDGRTASAGEREPVRQRCRDLHQ